MKTSFGERWLRLIIAIFLTVLFFNSCEKDITFYEQESDRISLSELKNIYRNFRIQEQLDFKINDSLEIHLKPDWSKMTTEKIDDSTTYSIIPLHPEGIDKNINTPVIYFDQQEFIMFKNTENIYRGVFRYKQDDQGIIFDRKFLNNGDLSLTSFVDGKSSIYEYSDGKGSNVKSRLIGGSRSRPSKGNSYAINSKNTGDCEYVETITTCEWWTACDETGEIHIISNPRGVCSPPPSLRCGNSTVSWNVRDIRTETVCVGSDDPTPPGGGGGGDDGGGDGDPGDDHGQTEGIDVSALTEEDREKFEKAIDEIKESCELNEMLNLLSDYGVSMVIDNEIPNPKYTTFEKVIRINDWMIGEPMFLAHELIHAYQNLVIGDTYHHHSAGLPGYINVEFERMLLQDVASHGLEWAQHTGIYWVRNIDGFDYAVSHYRSLVEDLAIHRDVSKVRNFRKRYWESIKMFNKFGESKYAGTQLLTKMEPLALNQLFDGTHGCN